MKARTSYSKYKNISVISELDLEPITRRLKMWLLALKGNISCYILLLKYPLTLKNTKFIAGELSLKISLVLYLPTGHYEL